MSSPHRKTSSRFRLHLAMLFALVMTIGFAAIASALTIGNVDGVWGNPTPSNTSSFRWCRAMDNQTGAAGPPTRCSESDPDVQNGGNQNTRGVKDEVTVQGGVWTGWEYWVR